MSVHGRLPLLRWLLVERSSGMEPAIPRRRRVAALHTTDRVLLIPRPHSAV